MVICEIFPGLTQTPLIGAYLPLSTLEHLPDLDEDLQLFRDPNFLGGLKVDLNEARIPWIQRVADLLTEYGLIDLVPNFRQQRRFLKLKTWYQVRQGTVLQSRCDYILRTDRRIFELVGIQYMRNFSSDHFALRARCHVQYLRKRRAFPLILTKL